MILRRVFGIFLSVELYRNIICKSSYSYAKDNFHNKAKKVCIIQGQPQPHIHSKARVLKEQYPVTAHAPNFDFWTGCREIKRCEESKRTLKNPFASRLVEFDTTLKLLRITDQRYIVPVEFRFGRNRDFLELLSLPLTGGPKDGKRFDAD